MKKRCVRCKLEYPEEETECEICRLPLVPVEEEAPKAQAEEKNEDAGSDMTEGEPSETTGRRAPFKSTFLMFGQGLYMLLGFVVIVISVAVNARQEYGFYGGAYLLGMLIGLLPSIMVGLLCVEQGIMLGLMIDTNEILSEGGERKQTPYNSKFLSFMQKTLFVLGCIMLVVCVLSTIITFASKAGFLMSIVNLLSCLFLFMESKKIGLLVDTNRKAIR